jgi:chromosome segregation ATPase
MLLADSILDSLEQAYAEFHRQHNLPKMQAPRLNLSAYRNRISALAKETEAFCRDPANLLLEKHFMIRRFYASVVEEARKAFGLARQDTERWLRIALDPVMARIREHKQQLDNRLDGLKRILENMGMLQTRMGQVKDEIARLRRERDALEAIAARLADSPGMAPENV